MGVFVFTKPTEYITIWIFRYNWEILILEKIMNRWVGFFMVIMGILMAAMWSFFLLAGMVPELKTVPFITASHLTAEYGTAIMMFIGGLSILNQKPQAEMIALVALGMYLYAVIQAPGYYLQQGVVGFVIMFAVLLVLGISAVTYLFRQKVS
jgi:hypothetical protein